MIFAVEDKRTENAIVVSRFPQGDLKTNNSFSCTPNYFLEYRQEMKDSMESEIVITERNIGDRYLHRSFM